MEDLYGTAPSSGTGLGPSEPEDITNFLNQLLHGSSSSPYSSAASSSSRCTTTFKAKYAHLIHSPHQTTASFSDAEDRLRFARSENRTEQECRVVGGSSGAGSSSGFDFSGPAGAYFGAEVKDGAENNTFSSDANTPLKGRRISPENDLGDLSCDSEGPEALEMPSNSAPPPRSSSKRSRAAEVHNLSEKRRRSRINEKMKALQNLIPNSNKTDKASMLDEAIEYLKQLQLQVQMLSMRNGLIHPMSLPGVLHPMQLPLPQTGLGYNEGIKFLDSSGGMNTFSGREENMMQSTFNLSNPCTISNQPVILPSVANVASSEASLGFEHTIRAQYGPINHPTSSKELCDNGKP